MSAARIEQAMARITAAMERIENARASFGADAAVSPTSETGDSPGTARVMALVNAHEKLREEVADTIGQIDTLIEELEA